jgi:hypothetical protein
MPVTLEIDYNIDVYYLFGSYVYDIVKPDISPNINIDMFKYILGKLCLSGF